MPSSLNKVMLIGNLGRDAETRHTPNGTAVVNFSLATTRRFKDQATGEWRDETEWHRVVLWRGENVAPYLTRGKKVYVEGRLKTRSWDAQDGQKRYTTEVICDAFGLMLLGSRDAPQGGGQGGYPQGVSGGYGQGGGQGGYNEPPRGSSGQGGGQRPHDAGGQAAGPVRGGAPAPTAAPATDPGIPPAGGTVDEDDDIPF